MKVAAIQMISGMRCSPNLEQAYQLLLQACRAGAELLVLPEYFCAIGQNDTDKLRIQEPMGQGPLQDFLSQSAHDLGVWLVGGTIPLTSADANHAYNSTLVYSPQGACVARYDKIHLFEFNSASENYDESRTQRPGLSPSHFDLASKDGNLWRIGLSVCYDLRFPELYRAYTQSGVNVFLVPSAFTYSTGRAHWEVLLRARAIENLSYVVAAAQGGEHENGRRTWGHSMVVDPWGNILEQQAQGCGVVMAELDAQVLQRHRAQLPALDHRRLSI